MTKSLLKINIILKPSYQSKLVQISDTQGLKERGLGGVKRVKP